ARLCYLFSSSIVVVCSRILPSVFFFYCSLDHRDLHSFPTRRSSDLIGGCILVFRGRIPTGEQNEINIFGTGSASNPTAQIQTVRSEEHTSELQSPCNLVCRLLLEKKKKRPHGIDSVR